MARENLPAMDDLEHGRVYKIKCRNLRVGVWDKNTGGFIGIRYKFGDRYLFNEYHWDRDEHYGTVTEAIPMDLTVGDIPVVEDLGTVCQHERYVEWRNPDENHKWGYWVHLDDGTEVETREDRIHAVANEALFNLLDPLDQEAIAEWQKEFGNGQV